MKKFLVIAAVLTLASFGFASSAQADTVSAGGVSYTFTDLGNAGSVYTIDVSIDTTGAVTPETLSSFSVQFTGASSVSLAVAPDNTWSVLGLGPNTGGGCNINGKANHFCSAGDGLATGSVYDFQFTVDMGGNPLPALSHIQAFQGTPLAISDDVGIGTPGVPTPEPDSLTLLGLGLLGAGFLRRRKQ